MGLREILELFGWSLVALAAMSVAAPLMGVFLYARGAAFQGIVLPQLAAFGVALGYAVAPTWGHGHTHAVSAGDGVHFVWAAVGVVGGLGFLTWSARRGGSESARLAAVFVLAQGGTVLAAARSPFGGVHLEALLSGEALAVRAGDAGVVCGVAAVAVLVTVLRWRDLGAVALDREFARVVRVRVVAMDVVLGVTVAGVVVVGTLSIGPLPVFALLVLPALAARRGVGSLVGFLWRAGVLGLVAGGAGAVLSFWGDLPLGAAVVAGAGGVWCVRGLRF